MLPSSARSRGAGRADVARARRATHRGDRPRVPRSRGDDEAAALAGEAEDQGRRHPVPCSRRRATAGAAGSGARGRLPDLQRGLQRPRRSCGGGAPARLGACRADAGRAGGARPAGADAAQRSSPRGPVRGQRARAARGPGPFALERRPDRRRARGARAGALIPGWARRVRHPGGDRVAPHGRAARLAADRCALRRARAG